MPLRIQGGDRPGLAILEIDGSLNATELLLSFRSLISRSGLYLTRDGNWEKAPHYFKAVRLGYDGEVTTYGVGPDVVNHLVDQDTVQIATPDGALSHETLWENVTPELPGTSRGRVHVPQHETKSPNENPPPIFFSPSPPPEGAALPEPIAVVGGMTDVEELSPPAEPPITSSAPPIEESHETGSAPKWKFSRASIWGMALGAIGVAAITTLSLLPEQRCRWFGGVLGGCGNIEAAIACLADKTQSSPCFAKQACAADPDAPTWSPGQSERLTQALSRATAACANSDRDAASQATVCLENVERNANACGASDCIKSYDASFPSGSARDALRQRADNDDTQCGLEADVARTAFACAHAHELQGRQCELQRDCVDDYARDHPNGSALAELRRRASAANAKCTAEDAAARRAGACLDGKRASRSYCDASRCLQDYRENFPGGRALAGLEAQAAGLDGPCQVSRVEKDAVDCAKTHRETPCEIDELCVGPGRARLAAAQSSPLLDGIARDAAEACRNATPPPPPPPPARPPETPVSIPAPPPVPAGDYSGSVTSACGQSRQTVEAEVAGDHMTWTYRNSTWSGTIDADQNVTANASDGGRTYHADGTFPNHVVMHYPDCNFSIFFRLR
jgi:hypothetical protein